MGNNWALPVISLRSEMSTVGRSDTEIHINIWNNSKFFCILKRHSKNRDPKTVHRLGLKLSIVWVLTRHKNPKKWIWNIWQKKLPKFVHAVMRHLQWFDLVNIIYKTRLLGRSFEFEGNRPMGTLRTRWFSLVGLLEHSKTGRSCHKT